jgi:hypothetical protein
MHYRTKISILTAYSSGSITWREASEALGVEGFEAFESLLRASGFRLYEPDAGRSAQKMGALNALLDEGL